MTATEARIPGRAPLREGDEFTVTGQGSARMGDAGVIRPRRRCPNLSGGPNVAQRTCSVDGCERPSKSLGWCGMHYGRQVRSGTFEKLRAERPSDLCSIDGCERPFYARTWCDMHYTRWRVHGDPMKVGYHSVDVCSIEGCGDLAHARRMCPKHYARWRRHGDPLKVVQRRLGWPGNLVTRLRFMPPDALSTGCVEFTGRLDRKGYGRIAGPDGRGIPTHAAAWVLTVGEVPDGRQLHHRCQNKSCVNPGHLAALTSAEHVAEHRRLRTKVRR